MYTKNFADEFVKKYCPLYFFQEKNKIEGKEYKNELGANLNCTTDIIEKAVTDALRTEKKPLTKEEWKQITWKLIAWKSGRLKYDEEKNLVKNNKTPFVSKDKDYSWNGRNGHGNLIVNIDEYIDELFSRRSKLQDELLEKGCSDRERIKKVYKELLILIIECEAAEIGPVYIFTLIYYLSKGEYPIYDKFAYKAILALDGDKNPADIPDKKLNLPDKTNINKVIDVYCDYCKKLERLFGTHSISREQDRALWVYGHSVSKYSLDDKKQQ